MGNERRSSSLISAFGIETLLHPLARAEPARPRNALCPRSGSCYRKRPPDGFPFCRDSIYGSNPMDAAEKRLWKFTRIPPSSLRILEKSRWAARLQDGAPFLHVLIKSPHRRNRMDVSVTIHRTGGGSFEAKAPPLCLSPCRRVLSIRSRGATYRPPRRCEAPE